MTDKKAPVKKAAEKVVVKAETGSFAFGKENYTIMAIGLVVIIIGFFLMSGKEDIFSSTKLTVAPIVVVLGFLIEVVAIMRKPKD
jgi:isoprenylcysteine carboxyl methyltransferase (ICMT) family protein YpbQ